MTKLNEILDVTNLQAEIDEKYIRTQVHPTLPYTIYNYTEKAAYEDHWTAETLTCRGLIVEDATGEVIARPFPKFFNYSQLENPPAPDTFLRCVTDKADGSLGIIYSTPQGAQVATRGSFASDQAIWATEWLNDNPDIYTPKDGITVLVEIIYPSNRIVLDYFGKESLVLLGGVEIATGKVLSMEQIGYETWRGERVEWFDYLQIKDVLDAPNRQNAEGLVALTQFGELVKFKQDDYVALHRIVTGLNEKSVYEALVRDGNVDALIEVVPDEFHEWVREVAERILTAREARMGIWQAEYAKTLEGLSEGFTQKDFALAAVKSEHKAALFVLHKNDNKKLGEMSWKDLL